MSKFALLVFLPALMSTAQLKQAIIREKVRSKQAVVSVTLTDEFAKSSLRVLRKVEEETEGYEVSSDGSMLAPRLTQEALDDLDIDATSTAEQAVVHTLQLGLTAHLMDNTSIAAIVSEIGLYEAEGYGESDLHIVEGRAAIHEMKLKESSCYLPLEEMLRGRKFRAIPNCSEAVLSKRKTFFKSQAMVESTKVAAIAALQIEPSSTLSALATGISGVLMADPHFAGHRDIALQLAREISDDPQILQRIIANNNVAQTSPATESGRRWDLATSGHVLTPDETAQILSKGQASMCLISTSPVGAHIYLDGDDAGFSPQLFSLMRHGDQFRTITIKMEGFVTVTRDVAPDGKDITFDITLVKSQ